jgi:DNA polymerase phi
LTSAIHDNSLNAAQAKDIFKLASQAVRQSKRILTSDHLSTLWMPDSWEELRTQFAASERFKSSTGLLNSCKQIIEMIRAPSAMPAIMNGVTVKEKNVPTKTGKLGKRKAEDSGAKQAEGQEKSKRKKTKKV